MNLVLKYLEGLPAFPASAADLSPKSTSSKGSTSEETADLSSQSVKKKQKLVRSFSINAAQRDNENGSSVGYFVLAFIVMMCGIFCLLISSSMWKLVEGGIQVYSFIKK